MTDHSTDHSSSGDPLAAIKARQEAEADAEREAGVGSGAEPGGPAHVEHEPGDEDYEQIMRERREVILDGLLHLAPEEMLRGNLPSEQDLPAMRPDLRTIPASAEVVRQLRADVRNLAFRVGQAERETSRERIFVWGEIGVILVVLILHRRALIKLAKAAA